MNIKKYFLLIFFFSGFSSLIYQIVWQRLLTLYYGVGNISVSIIIGTFLLGLGVGSWVGGTIADRVKHRISLYFITELILGVFGILSYEMITTLAAATAGANYSITVITTFGMLCIPTFLMGFTFPLLTRILNHHFSDFFHTISQLYFVNTLGAVFGALLGSYVLISFWGLDRALYCAAAINLMLALSIWSLQRVGNILPEKTPVPFPTKENILKPISLGKWAYILTFTIGFVAIGYEVVAYRVLNVILKNSPYVFSSMLGIYLLGIALGSFYAKQWLTAHPNTNRVRLFFYLQLVLGGTITFGTALFLKLNTHSPFKILTQLSFSTDLHPNLSSISSENLGLGIYRLLDVFMWPLIILLIPTLLLGASFPLLASLVTDKKGSEGKQIGKIYFGNILGNFLGSLITGFLLLQWLGTEMVLFIYAGVHLLIFGIYYCLKVQKPGIYGRMGLILVLGFVVISLYPGRGSLYKVLYPPYTFSPQDKTYFSEGLEGVVMSYERQNKLVTYIGGIPHGGRGTTDDYGFHFEALEALSYVTDPAKVLIIGFGTGYITEAVQHLKDVPTITIVEINKTLINHLKQTQSVGPTIQKSKNINWIFDDGRRFLLRTNEIFDAILIDPLRTTSAYSNNLYSQEFFQLAKNHLKPGGVFMMWTDEFSIIPKTVASVFPHTRFYNFFCISSNKALTLNVNQKQETLDRYSPSERLLIQRFDGDRFFLGEQQYIDAIDENIPINQDHRPWCEYYLGKQLKKIGP